MKTRARISALLIASSVVLSACGGSDKSEGSSEGIGDKSPKQILAASKKQLAAEEFISINGAGVDKEDGTKLEVDLDFAGETASGTIGIQGLSIELLKAEGKAYFKASDDFYRSTAGESADQVISLISGRWVIADPEDENFGEIASFVSKDDFFDELLDPDSKLTKVDGKKINGVETVGLKSTSSTFYFDKSDGKPVSLVTEDDGSGTLDFTYDKLDEAQAPAADDVVDLATLGG